MKRYYYVYIPLVTVMASCAVFKGGNKKTKKTTVATPTVAAKPAVVPGKNGIKPYSSVITKNLVTQKGLFTVHSTKEMDSIFFEISDKMLGRDILVVNRIKKAPGGTNAYPGEELDNNTVIFEKGPNETIRVRLTLVQSGADSTNAIYRAVTASNVNPIIASFPIKAYGKDSASYVIDMSKFLRDPNSFVNSAEGHPILKRALDVKAMKELEVQSILALPENVEIDITKNGTTKAIPPTFTSAGVPARPATMETNTSFIALPEKPMQLRLVDQRVGYFADYYVQYGDAQQKIETREFLNRWRLEPKPEDLQRYMNGELVEPAKPIVLYIDPATPKQWRKYLIMGVKDWQTAFEQAGFKNAIVAKEWPENDTSMHMEDVRYSFINYFASEISNAYGPNIHDPRSGEIIQTHIGWYHNVMQILHDWYMVQASPNDEKARKAKFDEELMGQLIRFVSSHEVGHTLGLRHNFGSSSQTPVDSLRNINYLRQHGHTASIMDYARFNYVAQPEDHIPEELLFPRIGEYDKWAIEFGYKITGAKTAEEDKKIMNKLVTTRLAANNRLWFGDGESRQIDPRCQTEDLGDDAAKAGIYGIKNLKRVMANLKTWTYVEDGQREALKSMYENVMLQYHRYMVHVVKNIAAVNYTVRGDNDDLPAYAVVPKAKQVAAVKFFNDELFNTPTWLIDPVIRDQVANPADISPVDIMQTNTVNSMLDVKRINYIMMLERRFGPDKTLGIMEYMSLLHQGIWSDLNNGTVKIDAYHRNMQQNYLGALYKITRDIKPEVSESEASSIANADIKSIAAMIKKAIPRATDAATKAHLVAMNEKIQLLAKKI
ncbi:zinc-dependent metalloprotease [Chitinophaga sp.]|uniref:zinc-dependent metalloprotease n=1 Tax=Chitinophaga sp. TaxID=1869181 RepID=UPI002F93F6C3